MTEDCLVGGWLLLTVTEDLVGASAGRLRQRLLDSPAGAPLPGAGPDRGRPGRLHGHGGVLISAVKRLRACNGQLRPAVPRGDVARALHATGLDKVLLLSPDVASALEL